MLHKSFAPRAGWFGVVAVVAAVGLGGCSESSTVAPEDDAVAIAATNLPSVVVTTSVLCDLTQQVAGDTIALTCLMEPGQDPHTYQAKPSDRQAIDGAALVIYDGYDAAPNLLGLVNAAEAATPKVAVYEVAVPEPLMGAAHDHDHGEGEDPAHDAAHDDHGHGEAAAHDHAAEDGHGHEAEESLGGVAPTDAVPDPHIWHNARNNAAMVEVIAASLAAVNPTQASFYSANATQLAASFMALDGWIKAQVETIPVANRQLVTTHDSFQYFADAYGVEVKGALGGLSTSQRPSAKTLTDLVDQVKTFGVPAIFAESTTNPELINAVANDAGVKVAEQPLFVEGPGVLGSGAETVQAMLIVNTCTIVNALGGTCAEATAPR